MFIYTASSLVELLRVSVDICSFIDLQSNKDFWGFVLFFLPNFLDLAFCQMRSIISCLFPCCHSCSCSVAMSSLSCLTSSMGSLCFSATGCLVLLSSLRRRLCSFPAFCCRFFPIFLVHSLMHGLREEA